MSQFLFLMWLNFVKSEQYLNNNMIYLVAPTLGTTELDAPLTLCNFRIHWQLNVTAKNILTLNSPSESESFCLLSKNRAFRFCPRVPRVQFKFISSKSLVCPSTQRGAGSSESRQNLTGHQKNKQTLVLKVEKLSCEEPVWFLKPTDQQE